MSPPSRVLVFSLDFPYSFVWPRAPWYKRLIWKWHNRWIRRPEWHPAVLVVLLCMLALLLLTSCSSPTEPTSIPIITDGSTATIPLGGCTLTIEPYTFSFPADSTGRVAARLTYRPGVTLSKCPAPSGVSSWTIVVDGKMTTYTVTRP